VNGERENAFFSLALVDLQSLTTKNTIWNRFENNMVTKGAYFKLSSFFK